MRKILKKQKIKLPYGLVLKMEEVQNTYSSGTIINFLDIEIKNGKEIIFGDSLCMDELKQKK